MTTNRVLAFAGSNSSASINHQLVESVARAIGESVEVIRLTDYDIPMYSFDDEQANGFPAGVDRLFEEIQGAGGLIISLAEHNGNVTAFFKSVFDWLSRKDRSFLADNKILLMSTSPGKGGGKTAHGLMQNSMPFFGGKVVASFNLPEFYQTFQDGEVVDGEHRQALESAISEFKKA